MRTGIKSILHTGTKAVFPKYWQVCVSCLKYFTNFLPFIKQKSKLISKIKCFLLVDSCFLLISHHWIQSLLSYYINSKLLTFSKYNHYILQVFKGTALLRHNRQIMNGTDLTFQIDYFWCMFIPMNWSLKSSQWMFHHSWKFPGGLCNPFLPSFLGPHP